MKSLRQIVESEPFQGISVTPDTRLYVTFFSHPPRAHPVLPYESKEKDLRILGLKDGALFTVLTLSAKRGSVDAMGFIEKTFGREVTTRNWNTILRVVGQGS